MQCFLKLTGLGWNSLTRQTLRVQVFCICLYHDPGYGQLTLVLLTDEGKHEAGGKTKVVPFDTKYIQLLYLQKCGHICIDQADRGTSVIPRGQKSRSHLPQREWSATDQSER